MITLFTQTLKANKRIKDMSNIVDLNKFRKKNNTKKPPKKRLIDVDFLIEKLHKELENPSSILFKDSLFDKITILSFALFLDMYAEHYK